MTLNKFGKFLVAIKVMWYWKKDGTFDFGLNWRHPLTWIFIIIQLLWFIPFSMVTEETYFEMMKDLFKSVKRNKNDNKLRKA